MSHPETPAVQIVNLPPRGAPGDASRTTLLLKTNGLELHRVFIPAGEDVPTYEAQGEVVLHCLEGVVQITAHGTTQTLHAGQLLHLIVREPFSMLGQEDAVLLLTVLTAQQGPQVSVIGTM